LTLLVVSLTTALLTLSNLSYVLRRQAGSVIFCHNHGWPLVWYRAVYADVVSGWQIHRTKLALNAAVWLLMLVAAAGVCEWLLRRYRPKLRWSLRTMLVVTALAAAFCGWFTVASRRARQHDEIVALFYGTGRLAGGHSVGKHLWIERWGPRWLDLFGAERYCQRVAGASLPAERDDQWTEDVLNRLKDLSGLQLFYLESDQLSPAAAESLNAMRQLRILSVSQWDVRQWDADNPASQACLAAVARMSRLEEICLGNLSGPALAKLGNLHQLRSLHLKVARSKDGDEPHNNPPLLTCLPVFARLEALTFDGPYLCDEDLRRLAAQAGLKSLRIETEIIDADLAQLRALDMLEELTIAAPLQTDDILALCGLKRVKALHIDDTEGDRPWKLELLEPDFDIERAETLSGLYRQALSALGRARPGIVIDMNTKALDWDQHRAIPSEYESPIRFLQPPLAPWFQPSFWKDTQFSEWTGDVPW
jgi:hypothetical protein